MPVNGLGNSYQQPDNGMTLADMEACQRVATKLNEVIIFRSTGPWSQRWIERNYPTKNFHVKGKSSDWGPQAGFVPYLGKYSKVGGNAEKEKKGTAANDDGLAHGYTTKTQLCLTLEELSIQRDTVSAGRRALTAMTKVERSEDYILLAERSSDHAKFAFRAVWSARDSHFKIFVFDKVLPMRALIFETPKPLEVMTSSEAGAHNKPLTGDYDLMAVCPTWGNYMSRSVATISKPGVNFQRHGGVEPGQTFAAGTMLDAVVDMRTNTGARGGFNASGQRTTYGGITARTYDQVTASTPNMSREHADMGNITPRILRCINELNAAMGQAGPFRRVHHNAESHRNVIFGGITGEEMEAGEAFPLTTFQPAGLKIAGHDSVSTLLNLPEFKTYAALLHNAGYFVPRSWVWGMSIRDGFLPSLGM